MQQVGGKKYKIVPLELKELNELVESFHRHHKRVQGHRFSIGLVNENNELVGGCSVGRPVARFTNSKEVLEITRLVVRDGEKNACSALYSASARIGKALGYKKIQSFILDEEPGQSLFGAGWELDGISAGGQWKHTDGKPRRTDQPTQPKKRFVKIL